MSEQYADPAHRYRLDARIAVGGMGEVWRGTDTTLGREVAIKLLKHEYADDAQFRARFSSEASTAARLDHPGVARVYDYGDGDGVDRRSWLVMELVDGQPLSALLRPDQPMGADIVRDLLAQAGAALGAAHAAGVVHRDVKPANLLITPDRTVKITDFGIARAGDAVALTNAGEVIGTPQYLSPEQARGEAASSASDVYSLGVIAYQCLTGRSPFTGETPIAAALAHLNQPVPQLPGSVPPDLARVVTRSLSKDPLERYPDGAAFADALRGVEAPGHVPPTTSDESTQVLGAAAPVAAGAGAAAAEDPGPPTYIAPTPTDDPPEDDDPRRKRGWLPAVLTVLVLLAVIGIAALVLGSMGDDDGSPQDTETSQEAPSDTATGAPTQEPTTQAPAEPSEEPTPSEEPSEEPTTEEPTPTEEPTSEPPSEEPTTQEPTQEPTPEEPSSEPEPSTPSELPSDGVDLPGTDLPGGDLPDGTAPDGTAPDGAAPDGAAPVGGTQQQPDAPLDPSTERDGVR